MGRVGLAHSLLAHCRGDPVVCKPAMEQDATFLTYAGIASALLLAVSVGAYVYRSSASTSSRPEGLGAKKKQAEVAEEDPSKPRVRLLYGTQTGTAERFSKQLASELRKKYGQSTVVEVIDLENYKPETQLPREKLVVLSVATYGDGEPTDNAADFFNWLGKEMDAVEAGDKTAPLEVGHDSTSRPQTRCSWHFRLIIASPQISARGTQE